MHSDARIDQSRPKEDKPDAIFWIAKRKIAVELTQIPYNEVFRHWNKRRPYKGKRPEQGVLVVFPFEPHKWVETAVNAKLRTALADAQAICADECWLVLHPPLTGDNWPFSNTVDDEMSRVTKLLMRFGLPNSAHRLDNIFFARSDGSFEKIDAKSKGVTIAGIDESRLEYPSFSFAKFSIEFKVPAPGREAIKLEHTIDFHTVIVEPKDDYYKSLGAPSIKDKDVHLKVVSTPNTATLQFFVDGTPYRPSTHNVEKYQGQSATCDCLIPLSMGEETFHFHFSE